MTLPISTPQLPRAVVESYVPETNVRVGVVITFTGGYVTVRISGSDVLVRANLLNSYQPTLGDYVTILRQGGSWLVLGASTAMPQDNVVFNPSFELDGLSTGIGAPTGWVHLHTGGMTSVISNTYSFNCGVAPDGQFALEVQVNTASSVGIDNATDTFSSTPVHVSADQVWGLNAYVIATNGDNLPPDGLIVQSQVILYGYANETDVYPTGATFLAASSGQETSGCPWKRKQVIRVSGDDIVGATIPSGVTFLRATLQTAVIYDDNAPVEGGFSVLWDRVVMQRLA